jgi:hypothetical protein
MEPLEEAVLDDDLMKNAVELELRLRDLIRIGQCGRAKAKGQRKSHCASESPRGLSVASAQMRRSEC